MIGDIFLIAATMAALISSTITDIKAKEVPDWISYALIFSGLSVRLIYSLIFSDFYYFIYGLIGFGSMFLLGNILYHLKQWGGGDAKLAMGLGATLATKPFYLENSYLPFLLTLIVLIFIIGSLYGFIWSIILIFKNPKSFKEEFSKLNSQNYKIIKILTLILSISLVLFSFYLGNFKLASIILALLLLIYPYLFIAIKALENIHFYMYKETEKLVEGDWIAKDIKLKNEIVFHKKELGIEKKDIDHLIKLGVKKVLVKEGIPFVPPFLIGTIIALIFGNPFI
ncbi:prepilin peptidase [Candidatus Woesearchaeota archaeon]|nr:prepilin peptidase [Candidatus Woesearchaeota archaeon]